MYKKIFTLKKHASSLNIDGQVIFPVYVSVDYSAALYIIHWVSIF